MKTPLIMAASLLLSGMAFAGASPAPTSASTPVSAATRGPGQAPAPTEAQFAELKGKLAAHLQTQLDCVKKSSNIDELAACRPRHPNGPGPAPQGPRPAQLPAQGVGGPR